MALDTQNRRGSLVWLLPFPDASGVTSGDRAQLVRLFRPRFDDAASSIPVLPPSAWTVGEEPDSMTLLEIVQCVAPELKLSAPSYVVGNSDSNAALLLALAHREVWLERSMYAWPQLSREIQITLVAGQERYAFANDHDRELFETHWDSTRHWPLYGPVTPQEWQALKHSVAPGLPRWRYRIRGYSDRQLHITPTPTTSDAGSIVVLEYVSRTCIRPRRWASSLTAPVNSYCYHDGRIYSTTSGGVTGSTAPTHTTGTVTDGGVSWTAYVDAYETFRADTDVPLIDADVLCAGMIWRWRRVNGFEYADERAEWEDLIRRRYVARRGARQLQLSPRVYFPLLSHFNVPDGDYAI